MVKILSNGDVVPDDDPRVQQAARKQNGASRSGQNRFQTAGNFQQGNNEQPVNIFQSLNQRLVTLGIPPINIGDIVVEPIVSVGLLIALLVFGVHGLIFGIVLFVVSRWSTHGAPGLVSRFFGGGNDGDGNGGRGNRQQGRAGGGYRLGR